MSSQDRTILDPPPHSGQPALACWSGGKDSAMALQAVLEEGSFTVERLLTTVTEGYDRVTFHGVRTALLEAQARALGLEWEQVRMPQDGDNATFEVRWRQALSAHHDRGVSHCVFGDLFLEDSRNWWLAILQQIGMSGLYPLWLRDTQQLATRFVAEGWRAVVMTVDAAHLDRSFCGREFDAQFLQDLPLGVDWCGEQGEFHTFVYDGPIFREPVDFVRGEIVERSGHWCCDLLPAAG